MRNDKIKALRKRYIKEGYKLARKQLLKEKRFNENIKDEVIEHIGSLENSIGRMNNIVEWMDRDRKRALKYLLGEAEDIITTTQWLRDELEHDFYELK